jgi:hypothetical protein
LRTVGIRPRALVLAGLAVTVSASTLAAPVRGRCLIEVGGRKYLDGTCPIHEAYGTLTVGAGVGRFKPTKFYAYVSINDDGNTARGTWNGISAASHAHDELGELKREGSACWVNSTAKVCAWVP